MAQKIAVERQVRVRDTNRVYGTVLDVVRDDGGARLGGLQQGRVLGVRDERDLAAPGLPNPRDAPDDSARAADELPADELSEFSQRASCRC